MKSLFKIVAFFLISLNSIAQLPVTDGLQLRLDASGFASAGAIGQWDDISGNGRHALQAVIDSQPQVKLNQMNGLPVVCFDGQTDFLSAPLDINIGVYPDITIFCVFKPKGLGTGIGGKLLSHDDGDYDRTIGFDARPGGGTNFGAFTNSGIGVVGVDNILMNTPYICTSVYTPSNYSAWINGNNKVNNTMVANGPGVTNLFVGTNYWFEEYYDGDIAEVLIYNRILCDIERERVEIYLGQKWGIPLNLIATDIINPDTLMCAGSGITLQAQGGYSFSWSPSTGLSNTAVSNPFANPAVTTTYIVNVCSIKDSIKVNVNPLPILIISPPFVKICPGDSATISVSGADSYNWQPANGIDTHTGSVVSANPLTDVVYTVTGTNSDGCFSTTAVAISVVDSCVHELIYIPDSFTPNEDGKNDVLYFYGSRIKTIDIKIFNRWGNLLYTSKSIQEGWDGKYNNQLLKEDVYVCLINCTWETGVSEVFHKNINLLK